jgi:tRNA(His) guanylyltransferase
MNAAAEYVCTNFTEIFLAYGQSDEYSFIFNKHTTLFGRRTDKILSCMVSAFTAAYICNWSKYFEG